MRTTKSQRMEEAYRVYKSTYLANATKIEQVPGGFLTGQILKDQMDSFEEFSASIKAYQQDYKEKNPKSHGESVERLGKWAANNQTRFRSAKQASKIVERARIAWEEATDEEKEAARAQGWNGKLTKNDIYYDTGRAQAFWDWYDTLDGDEDFWGS